MTTLKRALSDQGIGFGQPFTVIMQLQKLHRGWIPFFKRTEKVEAGGIYVENTVIVKKVSQKAI